MRIAKRMFVAASAVGMFNAASGQEAQPVPAGARPATVSQLEEVLVTARRREESSQSVPSSITAYSAEEVRARNITDQLSLSNSTPSLVALSSGQPRQNGGFAIRGQGPAFGATPGTVGYFAEVPNGILTVDGRPGTFYDLATVQVLKGPQGTLFGKNATGGNVLFEPQKPTDELGGYAQVQVGNYNDREFQGAVNLPIVGDKVALRVSGAWAERDGFTKDVGPQFAGKDYDDLGYESVRVGLMLRPIDSLESYTVYRYYRSSDNGPGTVLIDANPTAGQAPFLLSAFFPDRLQYLEQQRQRGERSVAYNIDQYSRAKHEQLINQTSFTITPNMMLKNIVSYSRTRQSYGYDYDATIDPIAGQTSNLAPTTAETYFTEELQLQGNLWDETLRYVVGGFIDRQWPTETSRAVFDYFPTSILLGGQLSAEQRLGTRSKAGFTQLTLDVGKLMPALDGVSVTGGYRYTHDEATSASLIAIPPVVRGEGEWDYGSYTFGIDYRFAERAMAYVAARSAFKAGGLNTQVPEDSPYAEFPPEKLRDIEVGLKSEFELGDMVARVNLAAFRGNYTNVQRTTPTVSQGVLINLTRSAAEARIQGLEFEGTLLPIPEVQLSVAYAYTDSEYTKVTDANAQAVLQGAPFPYVAKNKAAFTARYSLPLPPSVGDVGLQASYTYQSKQSVAQTNETVYPYLDGYGLVNARLDWRTVGQLPLDISAFVTNLTDKKHVIGQFDSFASSFGFVTRTYGEPRMYGVQLRYSFE